MPHYLKMRFNTIDLVVLVRQAAELSQMDLDLIVTAALPQALEVRKNNPSMAVSHILAGVAHLVTVPFNDDHIGVAVTPPVNFQSLLKALLATFASSLSTNFIYQPSALSPTSFADAVNFAAFFLTKSCKLSGPCPVSVNTSSDIRS